MTAKAIDGVQNVILDLVGQTHDCSNYIDKLIDRHLPIANAL
jgi:hypothetical protein